MKSYQNWLLAVISGLLLVLSFPGFNLFPCAWFALAPLLIAIDRVERKTAFLLGLVTGAIYFFEMTYWIIPLYPYANLFLTVFAAILLTAYLCVYVGGFVLLLKVAVVAKTDLSHSGEEANPDSGNRFFARHRFDNFFQRVRGTGYFYVFSAAVFWTGLELIRSWFATGYPWGSIGYSQWNNLPAIQIASIVGAHGVSFLVVLVNAAIARVILSYPEWKDGLKSAVLPFALLIVVLIYGFVTLAQPAHTGKKLKVALVPGNIKQIEKWQPKNLPKIFGKYINHINQIEPQAGIDLLVLPETAIPANLLAKGWTGYLDVLKEAYKKLNAYLLLGLPYSEGKKLYNGTFLLSLEGEELGKYYKIHLVPFGEYTPLKRFIPEKIRKGLEGVKSDFDKGREVSIFSLPSINSARFGVVICFESVFGGEFRKFVKRGANFMGIITNDAWFEGTAAPEQHLSMAPFRAIENRVSVFRCANGGISGIINRFGKIERKLENPADIFIIGEVSLNDNKTIYTRYGEWFPAICLALTVLFICYALVGKLRRIENGKRDKD